jgi:acetyl-CoA carboxylase biotin carboxylase subunit
MNAMFKKVLIANRGEIAVRVIRTCREMGIHTVAVYSDRDAAASHVLEADEAVFLGEAEPSKSYLNIERIIASAEETGAEAIHPGYGFLAENARFAEQCEASGIKFIGPPAHVLQDLGNKTLARRIMERAGVPVIPGMMEGVGDPAHLHQEAERIGYPVMVKAVSGGGGKGMRIVEKGDALEEACISAMSEAEKAFGDGSVYLEKYLKAPRHVEFQILADRHGNAVHLFERECSIQRRHQKIIEETPSPAMTPSLRSAMAKAALSVVRASGYVNAGTVEFLLDRSGEFYFLEVNTRLQVEHPVTEMTTGIDMVRQQLEIAGGNPMSFKQEDITRRGHAIECRVYAEDPEADFFPSPGTIVLHREPAGPGIRVDSGIYEGFEVPMDYDPILSKLIATAGTREAARTRMIRALESYVILGIRTTIPFLIEVLRSPGFAEGDTRTDFLDEHFEGRSRSREDEDLARIAYVVEELASSGLPGIMGARRVQAEKDRGWPSPWETLGDWRMGQ